MVLLAWLLVGGFAFNSDPGICYSVEIADLLLFLLHPLILHYLFYVAGCEVWKEHHFGFGQLRELLQHLHEMGVFKTYPVAVGDDDVFGVELLYLGKQAPSHQEPDEG